MVPLAALQAYGQAVFIQRSVGPNVLTDFGFNVDPLGTVATIATMTAGTVFAVWLGELITEQGIGNGVSLIIFGGIVARLAAECGRLCAESGLRRVVDFCPYYGGHSGRHRLRSGGATTNPGSVW